MAVVQTNFSSTKALENLIKAVQASESQLDALSNQFSNQLVLLGNSHGWTNTVQTNTHIQSHHFSGVSLDLYGSNFSGAGGSYATITKMMFNSSQGSFDIHTALSLNLYSGAMSGSLNSLALTLGAYSAGFSGFWNINSSSGSFTGWTETVPTYQGSTTLAYKGMLTMDSLGNSVVQSLTKFTLTSAAGGNFVYTGTLLDPESNTSVHQQLVTALAGNDKITGSNNSQSLDGFAGNDTIYGGGGNDTLNGGSGRDSMFGQTGNDTYFVDNSGDIVVELAGEGMDLVKSSVTRTLGAHQEKLTLTGNAAINGSGNNLNNILIGNDVGNRLYGQTGADKLVGNGGADTLYGQGGNDNLVAGGGNDLLIGGPGKDVMNGGLGNDTFVFNAVNESLVTSSRDVIQGFASGDKIDVSTIDADVSNAGDQAFTFTDGPVFSGSFAGVGELFYDTTTRILWGNNDADAQADFSIKVNLSGLSTLAVSDFVL